MTHVNAVITIYVPLDGVSVDDSRELKLRAAALAYDEFSFPLLIGGLTATIDVEDVFSGNPGPSPEPGQA